MKVLIIIPAYNESLNIEKVVNNLIQNYSFYDYIIINDGSKDNTVDICKKNGYKFIDLPINLGLAGAFQTGIKYAYRMGYDAAIQLDGDGQHNPEYIAEMIKCATQTSAEIVIGSRFLNDKKPNSLRMLGGTIISFIIKMTTGVKITDPTSGMRLFGRSVLKEFANNVNYGPEPDTISYLIKNGVKVKEVNVKMENRMAGESYLSLKQSVKYMTLMCISIIFIQQFRKR